MPEESTPLLCPPDDLAAKLRVSATDARLLVALRAASSRFRGAVRWQVHKVDTTILANGTGTRDMILRARDVTDVRTVQIDGTTVEVEWDADGTLMRSDGRLWPRGRRNITVDLTYGFDPIPDDIAVAVQDQAEVVYNIIRGLSSKQVGGITLSYGQAEAVGVSQGWVDAVERYQLGGRA
ncbi:hypothetical protein [Nocardioides sp.]|uniref:hypothetical protein n=1 Tax=Nocardioides sp. TaxID=35761 RepID=UPI0039E33A87